MFFLSSPFDHSWVKNFRPSRPQHILRVNHNAYSPLLWWYVSILSLLYRHYQPGCYSFCNKCTRNTESEYISDNEIDRTTRQHSISSKRGETNTCDIHCIALNVIIMCVSSKPPDIILRIEHIRGYCCTPLRSPVFNPHSHHWSYIRRMKVYTSLQPAHKTYHQKTLIEKL